MVILKHWYYPQLVSPWCLWDLPLSGLRIPSLLGGRRTRTIAMVTWRWSRGCCPPPEPSASWWRGEHHFKLSGNYNLTLRSNQDVQEQSSSPFADGPQVCCPTLTRHQNFTQNMRTDNRGEDLTSTPFHQLEYFSQLCRGIWPPTSSSLLMIH